MRWPARRRTSPCASRRPPSRCPSSWRSSSSRRRGRSTCSCSRRSLVGVRELFAMTHPATASRRASGCSSRRRRVDRPSISGPDDPRVLVTVLVVVPVARPAPHAGPPGRDRDRGAARLRDGLRAALRGRAADAARASCASDLGTTGSGLVMLALGLALVRRHGRLLRRAVPRASTSSTRRSRPRRRSRARSAGCRRASSGRVLAVALVSTGPLPLAARHPAGARRRRARSGGRPRRVAAQALHGGQGLGRDRARATAASSTASTR